MSSTSNPPSMDNDSSESEHPVREDITPDSTSSNDAARIAMIVPPSSPSTTMSTISQHSALSTITSVSVATNMGSILATSSVHSMQTIPRANLTNQRDDPNRNNGNNNSSHQQPNQIHINPTTVSSSSSGSFISDTISVSTPIASPPNSPMGSQDGMFVLEENNNQVDEMGTAEEEYDDDDDDDGDRDNIMDMDDSDSSERDSDSSSSSSDSNRGSNSSSHSSSSSSGDGSSSSDNSSSGSKRKRKFTSNNGDDHSGNSVKRKGTETGSDSSHTSDSQGGNLKTNAGNLPASDSHNSVASFANDDVMDEMVAAVDQLRREQEFHPDDSITNSEIGRYPSQAEDYRDGSSSTSNNASSYQSFTDGSEITETPFFSPTRDLRQPGAFRHAFAAANTPSGGSVSSGHSSSIGPSPITPQEKWALKNF
ncbi:hypothetical protein IV203_027344 [Nitzschia inconspicua]|uniref:Uncharacterized protein n=1 Tax=Nitzschia inconspicua TaxID=303405 RepID=A0A9K3Q3F6_9STRA|nr:hypothetical protein IV203_027344 [Nitzschia inconspicua]